MNNNWQQIMENLAESWGTNYFGSIVNIEPIKPTWKTKVYSIIYHLIYFVAYYPLRLSYIIWDAIEDAFNDAWEKRDE